MKNQNNTSFNIAMYCFLFIVLGLLVVVNQISNEVAQIRNELRLTTADLLADEYFRPIAGSGSMRPMMDLSVYPNLKTKTRAIDIDADLYLTRVYIYSRDNETDVVHRLIGFWNITEPGEYYIFMGDDNDMVDNPIIREQIYEELVGIRYD